MPYHIRLDENGELLWWPPNQPLGIRPAISLASTVTVASGDGSAQNPYIVDETEN